MGESDPSHDHTRETPLGRLVVSRKRPLAAQRTSAARVGPYRTAVDVDLRDEPWQVRRERLELLAGAVRGPVRAVPAGGPGPGRGVRQQGRLEAIVLNDRQARYRCGSRACWTKVQDRAWYEREAWRIERG